MEEDNIFQKRDLSFHHNFLYKGKVYYRWTRKKLLKIKDNCSLDIPRFALDEGEKANR